VHVITIRPQDATMAHVLTLVVQIPRHATIAAQPLVTMAPVSTPDASIPWLATTTRLQDATTALVIIPVMVA
jgi:hypothetical protein